jgi:enoyl-CoA hydratase/carnithine racemase
MCCDIRIASEDAVIGLPEVSLGYIPSAGGSQTLPRHVPQGVAMQMILSGDPIDATTAYRHGLIQRLVPCERLYPEATALAQAIAARPPAAITLAKRSIRDGVELPLESAIALESKLAERALLARAR